MITLSQTFGIYELLNKYFGNEEDAKALASGIEQLVNVTVQSEKQTLATREDILGAKEQIDNLRLETKEQIDSLRAETKEQISSLRLETMGEIGKLRVETKEQINSLRLETREQLSELRLSTREDISRLEVRIESGFKDQLKWLILLMTGLCSLGIAAIKLL